MTLSGGTSSTVDAQGTVTTLGTLTVNSGTNTTLNVTGTNEPGGQSYTVALGNTSLLGNVNLNVASLGTLTLGALNDNLAPATSGGYTITVGGAGAVTLNSPAISLVPGTVVNINSGTLNSNNATALGTTASVNLNGSGTFSVGASQTISALNSASQGGGLAAIGSGAALTVGSTDNLNSNFSGVISGNGSLIKSGTGTLTLVNANTYQGGTTINGPVASTVAIGNSSALGTNTVTLAGGTLQFVPFSQTGSIGVHFGTDQQGGSDALALTTSAGVGSFAMTHWNNTTGAGASTVSSLINSAGLPTSASVSWNQWPGTQSAGGSFNDGSHGDNQLMATFLNTNGTNTVTFANIPYTSYEVVTYVGAEGGGANGRTAQFTVGSTPTFYYETDNAETSPYPYIQITNTLSSSNPGGNYAVTTGQTGSSLAISYTNTNSFGGIMGVEIINTSPPVTSESLANSISVTQSSSMALNGTGSDSVGPLSIGSSILSITGTSTGTNAPYTLTTGAVTLSGNATFNVANNGSGTGTLALGALSDGGTHRTITFTDSTDLAAPGACVTLSALATGLMQGTVVNVNGTVTLNSNNATALGSFANVTVQSLATLNLGASQTVSALNGAGTVNLSTPTH